MRLDLRLQQLQFGTGVFLSEVQVVHLPLLPIFKKLARFALVGGLVFSAGMLVGEHANIQQQKAAGNTPTDEDPAIKHAALKFGEIIGGIGGLAAGTYAVVHLNPDAIEARKEEEQERRENPPDSIE